MSIDIKNLPFLEFSIIANPTALEVFILYFHQHEDFFKFLACILMLKYLVSENLAYGSMIIIYQCLVNQITQGISFGQIFLRQFARVVRGIQ